MNKRERGFRITKMERTRAGYLTAHVCADGRAIVVNEECGSWLVPRATNPHHPHLEWSASAIHKEVLSPFKEALAEKAAQHRRRELAELGPDDPAPDLLVEAMRQAALKRAERARA